MSPPTDEQWATKLQGLQTIVQDMLKGEVSTSIKKDKINDMRQAMQLYFNFKEDMQRRTQFVLQSHMKNVRSQHIDDLAATIIGMEHEATTNGEGHEAQVCRRDEDPVEEEENGTDSSHEDATEKFLQIYAKQWSVFGRAVKQISRFFFECQAITLNEMAELCMAPWFNEMIDPVVDIIKPVVEQALQNERAGMTYSPSVKVVIITLRNAEKIVKDLQLTDKTDALMNLPFRAIMSEEFFVEDKKELYEAYCKQHGNIGGMQKICNIVKPQMKTITDLNSDWYNTEKCKVSCRNLLSLTVPELCRQIANAETFDPALKPIISTVYNCLNTSQDSVNEAIKSMFTSNVDRLENKIRTNKDLSPVQFNEAALKLNAMFTDIIAQLHTSIDKSSIAQWQEEKQQMVYNLRKIVESAANNVDVMTKYQEEIRHGRVNTHVKFTCMVMEDGILPSFMQSSPQVEIPAVLKPIAQSFTEMFQYQPSTRALRSSTPRKLTWLNDYSTIELDVSHFSKPFTAIMRPNQAAILLHFNADDSRSLSDLSKSLGLPMALVEKEMAVLLHVQLILVKEKQEEDIVFSVNLKYSSDQNMLDLLKLMPNETNIKKPRDETFDGEVLKALIMRLMKSDKVMQHDKLVEAVLNRTVLFVPQISNIQKAIDSLITQEYIERDSVDNKKYIYLA